MHPEEKNHQQQLPKYSVAGILAIWALTILVVQFTIWVTLAFLDFGTTWKECGLIAALWVFVAVWFAGLRAPRNK
jgi:hypothetical protein